MKVKYLDLATGRTAESSGISKYSLTEGNWSCDCNRAIAFNEFNPSGKCDGYKRYIVIGVEAELDDEPYDTTEVIKEANLEYYLKLHGGAWTDQSKAKPSPGEFVVGLGPSAHVDGDCDICTWDGDNWWSECGTELTDEVTHWMPIPPRPGSK